MLTGRWLSLSQYGNNPESREIEHRAEALVLSVPAYRAAMQLVCRP
jgi:hypothetical protein